MKNNMVKLNMTSPIDMLFRRYENLVSEASSLIKINRNMSMEKLQKAERIKKQIEELKLSQYN